MEDRHIMRHFKYYAIGHSYLKHGPFKGWQTDGYWGMAASAPENDYYHKFQDILKENFECKLTALAENHADYERLCREGVTEETYKNSDPYKHMKEVIETFKPNIITVFVGGGNTVANDRESLTAFFDILYDMIASSKQPDTVVICPYLHENIAQICSPVVKKYNFIGADVSFIHADKSRNNPYYAYKDYPEYDEAAAAGAVEFRTHPNDLGHLKIAEAIFDVAKDELERNVPECDADEICDTAEEFVIEQNDEIKIPTEPKMNVSFNGFNVHGGCDFVAFSSAPGTGASISAVELNIAPEYGRFYVNLSVDGDIEGKTLEFSCISGGKKEIMYCPIETSEMHTYEFDISRVKETISSFRISPNMENCFIRVESLGFAK